MTQNETNQLASDSLIQRAMLIRTESLANLLLQSAARLNPSLDVQTIKAAWLEIWIDENQNRTGIHEQE